MITSMSMMNDTCGKYMNYERGYMLLVTDIFYGPSIQAFFKQCQ